MGRSFLWFAEASFPQEAVSMKLGRHKLTEKTAQERELQLKILSDTSGKIFLSRKRHAPRAFWLRISSKAQWIRLLKQRCVSFHSVTLKWVGISLYFFFYKFILCLQVAFICISKKIRNTYKISGADFLPRCQNTNSSLR